MNRYTFEHWHLVDTFVYFSHKRISPPPPEWITAAHRHGTKILGTVIFEWKESIEDLAFLLRGPSTSSLPYKKDQLDFSPYFAHALIDLAINRGFSGYLINIEVALSLGFSSSAEPWPRWVGEGPRRQEMKRNCRRLKEWLKVLRECGRERFKELGKDENEWEIIWYDSVVFDSGELQWQDALTKGNQAWLEVTDGIFTNYTWARTPETLPPGAFPVMNHGFTGPQDGGFHPALRLSSKVVDEMQRPREDVFVGIDVFGRNCYGGMESWKSLEMIGPHKRGRPREDESAGDPESQSLGLSVALFAQGWTWEHEEPSDTGRSWTSWYQEDLEFWQSGLTSSGSNLCRPLSKYFQARPPPLLSSTSSSATSNSSLAFLFMTNFTVGSGTRWFVEGECIKDWTKEVDMKKSGKKLIGWTDVSVSSPKTDLLHRDDHTAFRIKSVEDDAWYGGRALEVEVNASSSPSLSLSTIRIPEVSDRFKLVATIIIKGSDAFEPTSIHPIISASTIKLNSEKTEVRTLKNGWIELKTKIRVEYKVGTKALKRKSENDVGEFGIRVDKGKEMKFLIGELRLEIEGLED